MPVGRASDDRRQQFRLPIDPGWASVTWAQTADTVKPMAAGLLALGIRCGSRTGSRILVHGDRRN